MVFLPQNPCCSQGGSSSHCGDPCNAQPIPTDYVTYSGPNLPCTNIRTCDTVTVALQKVDEQICSLQEQIDILQQTIENCCTTSTTTTVPAATTTTTSTSTTLLPTTTTTTTPISNTTTTTTSTIIPLTTTTTSTTIIDSTTTTTSTSSTTTSTTSTTTSSTTSTSSTTTSTSSTTTSTTTAAPCLCYSIQNTDSVDISVSYYECGGSTEVPVCTVVPVESTIYLCVQAEYTAGITVSFGTSCAVGPVPSHVLTPLGTNCTTAGDCSVASSTTTTTTTEPTLKEFTGSGVGQDYAEACDDAAINNRTLYSYCSTITFGAGCTVYTNNSAPLLTLVGYANVFMNGSNWDINSSTGVIIGLSTAQC